MYSLTIKELVAHKMRLLSTVFAVLLGVTLMSGTLVFTDTLTATFDNVLEDAHSGVDAMVRAPSDVDLSYGQVGTRMDADTIDTVRRIDGVAEAALSVTGYAQLIGPDGDVVGDQEQAPAFGFNWIDNPSLTPFRLAEGRSPVSDDEIVIDRHSANESGYGIGDVATVLTKAEPAEFTIVGVATFGTEDSAAGATSVLFTDDAAQRVLSSPGQVDGVVVQATNDLSQDEIAARLDDALPGLEVVTGATLVAEDQAAFHEAFGVFRVFLLVFAFVAVFVGAFMINNTFSITVAQRTRHLAMLRALGASRRQVRRTVLGESLAIGVIGSGVGLLAGVGVAIGLNALFRAMGVELPDGPMKIVPSSMAISALVGVLITVGSAWLPARRAGRVAPIEALREVSLDRSGASLRRIVSGTVVSALGVFALLAGLGGAGIELVGLGALTSMIGVAVLGPVLARPVIGLFGLLVGRRGVTAEMAVRNARRNPKRTARTAASLMIGVALVAFIAVFAASAKTSFGGSLEGTFTGTHIVDSGAYDGIGGLSTDLADELRTTSGVQTVSQTRVNPAVVDGSETTLYGFTAETVGEIFDLGSVNGDLDSLGVDGIAVDAGYAADHGWELGTVVAATVASGPRSFVVRATYANASEWLGSYFVDIAAFDDFAPDQLDFRVYAVGDDQAVRDVAAPYASAEVLDADQFMERVTGEIDQILAIIYALLALAVLIALLGIANTLALSIFERRRELGLLRAVGMARHQVRSMIRGEAIMIALFGTSLGLGVGSFFGWASIRALRSEGFEQFTYPVANIAVVVLVACVAGAIAAIAPARRAARLDVLQALAAD
jgi:putative ABC transport system permease protein